MNAAVLQSVVKGFLVPIYDRTDPATGRVLHGLSPQDFQKVRDGYACPDCLAEYGTYTPKCVLCGWERDIAADIARAPAYWQQSIDERENDRTPYAKPVSNPFDRMMGNLAADKDVDHVALSDLAKQSKVRRS